MTAERDSFEPATRSTFANTSDDSVIEVFSFILPLYYYTSRLRIPIYNCIFEKQ